MADAMELRRRKGPLEVDMPVQKPKSFVDKIRNLDAYAKTEDDFLERTSTGGVVSVIAVVLMGALLWYEVSYFMTGELVDHLSVDLTRHEKLVINMDITFPSLPCSEVNIDVMDVMGDPMLRMQSHIYKTQLDKDGNVINVKFESVTEQDRERELRSKPEDGCGDCHVPAPTDGTAAPCCKTCEEVKRAMRERGWDNFEDTAEKTEQCRRERELLDRVGNSDEGCRLRGYLEVNKIAGNFHFAPGRTFVSRHGHHIHEFNPKQAANFNVSHVINSLYFGAEPVPGVDHILDGTVKTSTKGPGVYQYFIKVIPTTFEDESRVIQDAYQFAVTEHKKESGKDSFVLPGVFFMYDLNPIRVTVSRTRPSFAMFLTRVFAYVGGIFTLSGLIDTLIHSLVKKLGTRRRMSRHSSFD